MDKETIRKKVVIQLKKREINYKKIFILEKKWGFIVQVDKEYNEIFDLEGDIIYPLTYFVENYRYIGPIYRTEIVEKTDEFNKKYIISEVPNVLIKELDECHFIIPGLKNNSLFYFDDKNNVYFKGFIEGAIQGSALTIDIYNIYNILMEKKLLLSYVTIDETKDKHEVFLYSWEKNCRISDKWSNLIMPNDMQGALHQLNLIKYPADLKEEIVKYMNEHEACLATLEFCVEFEKYHTCYMRFVCLIGLDGLPLINLTYMAPDYTIKTIPLEKEKIGEVDEKRIWLQEMMKQKILSLEENKKNLSTNFFKANRVESRPSDVLLNINGEDGEIAPFIRSRKK